MTNAPARVTVALESCGRFDPSSGRRRGDHQPEFHSRRTGRERHPGRDVGGARRQRTLARLDAIGSDQTKVTYIMGADVAPYLRPLVPALRWRLTRMFEKGLAGIEAQVARLRSEAAPRPESVLTDSI